MPLVFSRYLVMLFVLLLLGAQHIHSYATPELNRRAMAGLWRLVTTNPRPLLSVASPNESPMKEFTTYPKKCKEVLLMLSEDGSFQEYKDNNGSSNKDKNKKKKVKGTWDFLDGQLILATDRPKQPTIRDTILVGKVVASTQDSLQDNPMLKESERINATSVDTHLSVPQGSFKVGKYMYPKHHPSFFEQPIFRPTPTGSFELRQVLGNLNAMKKQEENFIEKFQRNVFYDKKFYLTSHPIQHKRKGHSRWSIKYNKFVEDPPQKKQQNDDEQEEIPIRVMQVAFFSNNTFSTIAGLGEDTILRGKWDIIGNTRNQLWMQVWRFGFGRSVSGSVYSEGKGLSKHDEKTYWGEISYIEDEQAETDEATSDVTKKDETPPTESKDETKDDENDKKHLQVKGSVLFGWGLEPQPVARFIMKESTAEEEADEIDEEEEEEDRREEDLERTFNQQDDDSDDIDWSTAFQ